MSESLLSPAQEVGTFHVCQHQHLSSRGPCTQAGAASAPWASKAANAPSAGRTEGALSCAQQEGWGENRGRHRWAETDPAAHSWLALGLVTCVNLIFNLKQDGSPAV